MVEVVSGYPREIIHKENDDNKVLAFSFSKILLTTNDVSNSRACKDSSNFKWSRKILAFSKKHICTSSFISNNLITRDHAKILGGKILDVVQLLNNHCEEIHIWFHHPGGASFTL